MRSVLWKVAMVAWATAILCTFVPDVATADVVEMGDIRFSFSQLAILLAIGFAWGDMRQWRAAADKRLEKIEKKLEGS